VRGRNPPLCRPHRHDGFVRFDCPEGIGHYNPAAVYVGDLTVVCAGGRQLDDRDRAATFVVRIIKLVGFGGAIG
jgi:hypothetical protein